ncbi:MAG: NfeD family protein [Alphaproteobacteria bacterium]|jgi:membrane protein implicated in regulation of membrane protease activity|nr:NfeD family protein [Alphaproteobacteria bacterium]
MSDFMQDVTFWYWLALGIGLMLVEVLVPGVLFLWLGAAAIVTGLILLGIPDMGWQIQLVVFAVLSIVSVYVGRRYVYANPEPTDHPTLNQRGENLVGQQYSLDGATSGGAGRVKVGDSLWAIAVIPQGAELPAGARIQVVRVDGSTLVVEAVEVT